MAEIFYLIGVIICCIGGIAYLVAAFRTSVLWGLACIFVAPVAIVYLFLHWDDAKKPFLIQIIGSGLMLVSAFARGAF